VSKRNQLAAWAGRLGFLRILEAFTGGNCLLVLTHHRIGDGRLTEFDQGVYSATGEELEEEVGVLRRNFSVVSLEEAVDLVERKRPFRGAAILITFDDGYLDNYQIAFPILRSHGVQGTFFLVSSYIGQPIIPWWDRIAFWVRNASRTTLRLKYPEPAEIPLPAGRRNEAIARVLRLYKSPKTSDGDLFLEELETACAPTRPFPSGVRLFLNREEAREMIQGGMAVGSHTVNHRILSKLPREEQMTELRDSRAALSEKIGAPVDTLAYPVGGLAAFNETTMAVAREAGYRAAFSSFGGINHPAASDCFNVRRCLVDSGNPLARFRMQVAGAIATKGYWF
jgi:peptidoglycan/xylan/chitin deacetylase (PgdA/CDA1 family)